MADAGDLKSPALTGRVGSNPTSAIGFVGTSSKIQPLVFDNFFAACALGCYVPFLAEDIQFSTLLFSTPENLEEPNQKL